MTNVEKLRRAKRRPPTSAEEENLLLEVLEDSRLRGIGIDPDGDTIDIMVDSIRSESWLPSWGSGILQQAYPR
ncbi:MAG TPA: hypothetical protein VNO32_60415 [Candidatus Acidoferrum sp.]|nr:hypothetical protein [Candidatus Acidoferrum sp.]